MKIINKQPKATFLLQHIITGTIVSFPPEPAYYMVLENVPNDSRIRLVSMSDGRIHHFDSACSVRAHETELHILS